MSYSVTGIQAIPASYLFAGSEHADSGVLHASTTKAGLDQKDTGDTVHATSHDKVKVQSAPGAPGSHGVSGSPVKAVPVAAPVDTVTLSTVDKVRNLRQLGEGDTQIASSLNLPIKEVQSDLHLNTHVQQSFTVAPVSNALSGVVPAHVDASV